MTNSTCIIVLGGHRCGTSAVAGALYHLGVFMGHRFIGPGKYNRKGHWEDKAFLNHHKQIIGDWKRPRVNFEPHKQAYSRLIRRREKHELWGFKDPRTIFIFPHLLEVIRAEVKIINIWRDLEASAKSMVSRRSKSKTGQHVHVNQEQARVIAELYREKQMQILETWEGERLDVRYELLCQRPRREVGRIAKFAGMPVTKAAVRFIEPKLRRF